MNPRHATLRGLLSMLLLLAAVAASAPSSASVVDISTNGHNDNVFVVPSDQYEVWSFAATVSGTVTLSVQDTGLGDLLKSLSTSITLFDGRKLQLDGNATAVFDIGPNERFTTSVFALMSDPVAGSRNWSLFNLDLAFKPKLSQVPLPLGGWLLVAGCGLLATRSRRAYSVRAAAIA